MGYSTLRSEITKMPFKLFSNGFTLTSVPFNQGFRRHESFVSLDRLKKASIESQSFYGVAVRKIKLVYDENRELNLDSKNFDDPFLVMKTLKKYVSEKMDGSFDMYLGDKKVKKIVKSPIPLKPRPYKGICTIFLTVFIFIMAGAVLPMVIFENFDIVGIFVVGIFLPSIGIFLFWIGLSLQDHTQKELIKYNTKASESGIIIPTYFWGRLIKKTRKIIPYTDVRIVRMKVEPLFFAHEAELETVKGEKFRVPYDVYKVVSNRSEFVLKNFDYVNKDPGIAGLPLIQWNKQGIAILSILIGSTFFIGSILNLSLFFEHWESVQVVCIMIIFAVLLPILFYSRIKIAGRARMGEGILATDKGIFLPNAPEKFRNISKKEFISASLEKDILSPYCELNTVKGEILLPMGASEKLIAGGYPVDNADDISPLPSKGYVGEPALIEESEKKPEKELPLKLSPGALIVEEPADIVKMKRSKMLKFGAGFLAIGIFILLITLFLYLTNIDLCGSLFLIAGLLVIIFIIAGVFIIKISQKIKPVKIHENGIFFPEAMKPDGYNFVPYGRIKTYTEETLPIWGDGIQFHLEGTAKGFVSKSIPGFLEAFEEIKSKIGNPKYDFKDFEPLPKEMFGMLAGILYAIAFGVGFGGALFFMLILDVTSTQGMIAKTLQYGAPITLITLAYVLYFLEFKRKGLSKSGHVKFARFTTLVVITFIMFIIGTTFNVPVMQKVELIQDSHPGTFVLSNGIVENELLTLSDNIYVSSNDTLTIMNTTIVFSLDHNKDHLIYVANGGSLEIINSTVTSSPISYGYAFEIHGEALLLNSIFSYIYGSNDFENGDGGLEIYSDDVLVKNCTISNNPTNGILIANSSPIIENCTIEYCDDDGIEIQDSRAVIRNNLFRNNQWAITVNPGSDCLIEGNTFSDNVYGITVDASNPVICNNVFENTENYAISVYDNSDPELENNTFENNGEDVKEDIKLWTYFDICGIITLVVGLVITAVVMVKVKKKVSKIIEKV
jgi:parallel beta-helix repeat protein